MVLRRIRGMVGRRSDSTPGDRIILATFGEAATSQSGADLHAHSIDAASLPP